MCVCVCVGMPARVPLHAQLSNSLPPHGLWSARLLCPWDFPGKSTAVGCHFLLQRIFLTQGWNPHLLRWQADSLPSEHLGKLTTLHKGNPHMGTASILSHHGPETGLLRCPSVEWLGSGPLATLSRAGGVDELTALTCFAHPQKFPRPAQALTGPQRHCKRRCC